MSKTRAAGIALGVLATGLAACLGLLVRPGVLFAHRLERGNLRVHSQQPLGPGVAAVLDAVDATLGTSRLYDRSRRHDIFFAHDNALYGALQRAKWKLSTALTGMQPALTYNESETPYLSHVVSFRVPDVDRDALRHPVTGRPMNLTRTLAHEVVHSLLQARFGNAIRRFPMWKQEGYAEYVAAASSLRGRADYDFWASVRRIPPGDLSQMRDARGRYQGLRRGGPPRSVMTNEAGFGTLTSYYVARLLMEYALELRGMSLEQVMSAATDDAWLLTEMLAENARREPSEETPSAPARE